LRLLAPGEDEVGLAGAAEDLAVIAFDKGPHQEVIEAIAVDVTRSRSRWSPSRLKGEAPIEGLRSLRKRFVMVA
jgi:hypothetical protein